MASRKPVPRPAGQAAPAPARDQVWRLLTLVPYLQAHPGVALAEAAREFGITQTQLRTELVGLFTTVGVGDGPDELIDLDLDAVDGQGRIYLSNADFLSRPMRFSVDEAMSLIVALRAIQEVATGPDAEATASALSRLTAVMDGISPDRVAVSLAGGPDSVRAAIAGAIRDRQRLRLVYDGATRAVTTTPVVDPARTLVRDGAAYLVGYSLDRGDWRTYRLDRIISAEPVGEPSVEHGEPPITPGWFTDLGQDAEVTLDLAPEASWVVEYYPMRQVDPLPGGGVRGRFAVADPLWLTRVLLRLAGGVLRVEPDAAAQAARQAAREALTQYSAVFGAAG